MRLVVVVYFDYQKHMGEKFEAKYVLNTSINRVTDEIFILIFIKIVN
jgi:hypothetical protein